MSPAALRRVIHAATGVVLVVPVLTSWQTFRVALSAAAVVAACVELFRLRNSTFRAWLRGRVPLFRAVEDSRPSGAFWLVLGYTGAAWFPQPGAASGILAAALADPAAAWIGGRFGRGVAKSWVGSAAAWVVGAAALVALGVPWGAALTAGAAGAGLERWTLGFDDNLLIAPGVAAALFFLA